MCEVAALLAEAMELLLKDADPRACQLRLRYEQLVLQNDVSSVDTVDGIFTRQRSAAWYPQSRGRPFAPGGLTGKTCTTPSRRTMAPTATATRCGW